MWQMIISIPMFSKSISQNSKFPFSGNVKIIFALIQTINILNILWFFKSIK